MANKIKIKRGLSSNINKLQLEAGELAITTDTTELYAGDKNNNAVKINNNTTYTLTKNGASIVLTGSDGSTQSVADSDTTYNTATTSVNGLMSTTDKKKIGQLNIAYGMCSTGAGVAAKEVVINTSDTWNLVAGAIVIVKFSASNTAANVTLNVNNTGAKSIWYNNGVYSSTSNAICGFANRHIAYVYNGTYWVWLAGGIDNNTTYSNVGLGNGYGTCSTEAETVAKTVTLSGYALSAQGRVSVKFDEDVPAAATLNINSKGAKAIYYKGAAITEGIILSGDIVTFVYNGTQYEIVNIYREDEDADQEYFGGSHISIDGNIISVSDLGNYSELLTTNKDTLVNAINELVGVDQALIGDINTVQTNLDTSVSNLQAQINNFANTGAVANAVSNGLVQIDGSKVEIGTTSSKLQVKGDGETFKLQSGNNAILEADSNKVSTLALSVSGSLNTGYHQLKKFTRGSEQRTGLFWIGDE